MKKLWLGSGLLSLGALASAAEKTTASGMPEACEKIWGQPTLWWAAPLASFSL